MKKTLLSAFLLLFGLLLQAQPEPLQQTIFFASGAYTLDKNSVVSLDKMAKEIAKLRDFELDIQAFTDDVGSAEANQALAAKRSAAIKDFFKQKGIKASSETIENKGEIELAQGISEEEQRRRNRRVEITVTPFEPQDLGDVFQYFQQRSTQYYTISSQEETVIRGKKGMVLTIPADCFTQKEGGAYPQGDIRLELREMLDYGDMIRANLSTVSDGKILETGGMFFLAATDSAGNELQIQNERSIAAVFPNVQQAEGMELFVADRSPEDIHQPINWQPKRSQNPVLEGYKSDFWSESKAYLILLDSVVMPNNSQGMETFPFSALPVLSSNGKKNKAYFKTLTKILREIKTYLPKINANDNPQSLSNYQDIAAVAEHINLTYNLLLETKELCEVSGMKPEAARLTYIIDSIGLAQKMSFAEQLRKNVLETWSYKEIPDSVKYNMWGVSSTTWKYFVQNGFSMLEKNFAKDKKWTELMVADLFKIYRLIELRFDEKKIADSYDYFKAAYKKLLRELLNWERVLWKIRNSDRFYDMLNNNAQLQTKANAALNISRLGWVNCDRFLRDLDGGKLITFSIKTDISVFTTFYLVFEDIRSVMPTEHTGLSFNAKNIPENKTVKIIGLRVNAGEVQTYMKEGRAVDLSGSTADFKPQKIEEVQRLLNGI